MAVVATNRSAMYFKANVDDYINALLPKALCDIRYLLANFFFNFQDVRRMN